VRNMDKTDTENKPPVVDRLRAALGSDARAAEALGANRNYMQRWRQAGYIPERWALDIHRLRIKDEWGPLDYWEVLIEAEKWRSRMMAEAQSDSST